MNKEVFEQLPNLLFNESGKFKNVLEDYSFLTLDNEELKNVLKNDNFLISEKEEKRRKLKYSNKKEFQRGLGYYEEKKTDEIIIKYASEEKKLEYIFEETENYKSYLENSKYGRIFFCKESNRAYFENISKDNFNEQMRLSKPYFFLKRIYEKEFDDIVEGLKKKVTAIGHWQKLKYLFFSNLLKKKETKMKKNNIKFLMKQKEKEQEIKKII